MAIRGGLEQNVRESRRWCVPTSRRLKEAESTSLL